MVCESVVLFVFRLFESCICMGCGLSVSMVCVSVVLKVNVVVLLVSESVCLVSGGVRLEGVLVGSMVGIVYNLGMFVILMLLFEMNLDVCLLVDEVGMYVFVV